MNTQNQVKRSLSQPAAIDCIRESLDSNKFLHRSELAGHLCGKFGFYDGRGKKQLAGCLKALRQLEAKGLFTLPAACKKSGTNSPRRLAEPVTLPVGVPAKAGLVSKLRLVRVVNEEQMRIWNELMIREHPQGAGILVGRQLRYLIGSEHGWLGGFGFGAAALQLADRDRWIGWNIDQRRLHLQRVISMSRFLIRPSVHCQNLASHMLGMCMAVLSADFEERYGYEPWLVESFADTSQVSGTCYRAANWMLIGRTKGRGRQDRLRTSAKTVKDIYVYALQHDFRARLGLKPGSGLGTLGPTDGLAAEHWAENEFGGAALGDGRLSQRLVSIAEAKAEKPGSAFTDVVDGNWAAVKGYYRLIDMPEESEVTMAAILAPHRERTVRRMMGQRTVLCIQDGSDLNYTSLAECEGLGVTGSNQTGAQSRGLHLHSMLAVATDGLPLGVVNARCIASEVKSPDDLRRTYEIPIEEKDTFCWIEGLRDMVRLSATMPHTRLISVCDREADFFELFDEQRRTGDVELLVRAKHNRTLSAEPFKLFEVIRQAPIQTLIDIQIPRQSARPKISKQQARPKRLGRRAELSIRYSKVALQPPFYHKDKKPLEVWVIHAREENPPPQTEAIEWFLLTTIDIAVPQTAIECLRWYCLRWRIEDWHRVLKSGCRIEELAHRTAERLSRAIAINLVIAWRIMLMTLLGRETPEMPAELLFSDLELEVLRAYVKKNA